MGAADLTIITEEPHENKHLPEEESSLPGMVNSEVPCGVTEKLVPGRFVNIRPISAEPRTGSNANPLLVARDSTDGSLVTLQEFQTVHEHARVRDCQRKCCLRANDAPNSPTSGLTSPMSSPIGEPMLCDILEIHGNVNTGGWLAVMEEGTVTLQDTRKNSEMPLSPLQKRNVFLRVARAVQILHSAGIVHNAISLSNVIKCSSGYKLGNYASLQRHGEVMRQQSLQQPILPPELKQAPLEQIKCSFAADVWCLGMLLRELVVGEVQDDSDLNEETAEAAASGDTVAKLICKMLHSEARRRPVVDVVLQEAIHVLYCPDDGCDPHESLDFDSPLKDHHKESRNSHTSGSSSHSSPVSKARLEFLVPPSANCVLSPEDDEDSPLSQTADTSDIKKDSGKSEHNDSEVAEPATSKCECRCSIM